MDLPHFGIFSGHQKGPAISARERRLVVGLSVRLEDIVLVDDKDKFYTPGRVGFDPTYQEIDVIIFEYQYKIMDHWRYFYP